MDYEFSIFGTGIWNLETGTWNWNWIWLLWLLTNTKFQSDRIHWMQRWTTIWKINTVKPTIKTRNDKLISTVISCPENKRSKLIQYYTSKTLLHQLKTINFNCTNLAKLSWLWKLVRLFYLHKFSRITCTWNTLLYLHDITIHLKPTSSLEHVNSQQKQLPNTGFDFVFTCLFWMYWLYYCVCLKLQNNKDVSVFRVYFMMTSGQACETLLLLASLYKFLLIQLTGFDLHIVESKLH